MSISPSCPPPHSRDQRRRFGRKRSGGPKTLQKGEPRWGALRFETPRMDALSNSPFWLTLISSVLLWLSFPPVGWSWLAWLAPVPMLTLVVNENLQAARPMVKIWAASFLFWLATFYFIPFPHPILIIGWLALSAYLAIFTLLMLVVARTMVWRWGVWPLVAVPVSWTGWEWVRMNFLTGFAMVGLSHSQYNQPLVIQIADLSGAYTVTFAIAAFATGVTLILTARPSTAGSKNRAIAGAIACVVIAALVSGYGWMRLSQNDSLAGTAADASGIAKANDSALQGTSASAVTIALIQTSIDTVLTAKTESQLLDELSHLRDVNWAARQADDGIDLIVWPESSYAYGNYIADSNVDPSVLTSQANLKEIWAEVTLGGGRYSPVPTIIGTSTIDIQRQQVFNSAVLVNDSGLPQSRYDKNHRVMFGEYVPVLEYFPSLMQYLPINRNLTPGTSAELFDVGSIKIAPNVCFETTVPHLIRRQLNTLATEKGEPDVLLNITNDGWFFGTSCLDLHYACNVFRAVELRKPMLVCANTGLSAHIDRWGIARKKGGRRVAEPLICEIVLDRPDDEFDTSSPGEKPALSPRSPRSPRSLYRSLGDVVPMSFGILCVVALLAGLRIFQNQARSPAAT